MDAGVFGRNRTANMVDDFNIVMALIIATTVCIRLHLSYNFVSKPGNL